MFRLKVVFLTASIVALVCFLPHADAQTKGQGSRFSLTSSAFSQNGTIPRIYSCQGSGESPALGWSGLPAGTKTLALILKDPDAPSGPFVHWVVYNIPGTATGMPANTPAREHLADGAIQGINSGGKIGYYPPCPPPGNPHHYHFQLLALDIQLAGLPNPAHAEDVEHAAKGHILAETELVGLYGRQ